MFDVDVLDGGAEVGEAPGDVVVVADDDEGNAGEGDAGDVKVAGGGGGLEVGLIPDAGDAVGEVHVVREEWLAGGGVGAGDDPVVGAGEAAFADGVAEVLLEGEEFLEGGRGGVCGCYTSRDCDGWGSGDLVVSWREFGRFPVVVVRRIEFGLGFVEGDVGDVFLRGGEVDDGLGGRVVAPGDYGVEIGDEVGGSFAVRASRLSSVGKLVVRSWNMTRPTRMVSRGVQGAGW